MLYLDTGCLLEVYYPESNSPEIAAAVAGEEISFTALHALEMTTVVAAQGLSARGHVRTGGFGPSGAGR